MDLASMLNDRPAPAKTSSSPAMYGSGIGSGNVSQTSPQPLQNGSAYAPPHLGAGQQTPHSVSSSASLGPQSQSQSRGLTPLQTMGQYPFPPQHQQPPLQSPASAPLGHPQQYNRPFEAQSASATTPGPRPPSHGYAFTQPSPSSSLGQYQSALNTHPSLSPTPSSHHSQTPHSVRQSPLAMAHQLPLQQQQGQPSHSHSLFQSQPNTPLGPPQLPQRHSANSQLDVSSPYHSRTLSGASSGLPAGSPQHHPSIGSLVGSPNNHNRPSPQVRSNSDHRSSVDRERSESVSPKTMIPPRPPSLGSRHSSQHEVHSARSSQQPIANVARQMETPALIPLSTMNTVQPLDAHATNSIPRALPQSIGSPPGPNTAGTSLSPPAEIKTHLQHQPQKMGMDHLLAPTPHAQDLQLQNGTSATKNSIDWRDQQHQPPLPPPQSESQAQPTRQEEGRSGGSETKPDLSALARQSTPKKRPAEFDLSSEPPAKRGKGRKYTTRPIWANLSDKNLRSRAPDIIPNGIYPSSRPQRMAEAPPPPLGPGPAAGSHTDPPPPPVHQQAVGLPNGGFDLASILEKPWRQNPPLDTDLLRARSLLGNWEKSLKWDVAMPSLTKAVSDWLWVVLDANQDIGFDPHEGSIEIEAKIGTLIDVDTGRRCSLPVQNACVINPGANRRFQFESEMNHAEHMHLNSFLNRAVQECHIERAREAIRYEHTYETDAFRALSDAGLRALPAVAHDRHQRRGGRELKLRTTTDNITQRVKARIVKIPLGDHLHLFGAQYPYDIRISINYELNLHDRPDLADLPPDALTRDSDRPQPDRKKDRVSYHHLAYHVDLTRVDVLGMSPKFELELEVDANLLRRQMELVQHRQPSAFGDVVEGFVQNMTWLMQIQR